jgi:hypothetical protein
MSNPRLVTASIILAVAAMCVTGSVVLSRPAHAETPREGVCKILGQGKTDFGPWMTEQMGTGKSSFVSPAPFVLCAY